MKSSGFFVFVVFGFVLIVRTAAENVNENGQQRNNGTVNEEQLSTITSMPRLRHQGSDIKRYRLNNNYDTDSDIKYCQREANCQQLNYTTCMGVKLPYTSTTLDLTDLSSQEIVQRKLQLYQGLKYIPKCWAVIQPFLCALYMPKCENGRVDLPSKEMCRVTLGPCKILYNTTIFPEFFKCENERLFPSNCKNDNIRELKFNTTGKCLDPLVHTDSPEWFYPDVEGCGLRCKDPRYTDNEHDQIHKLVAYCSLLCLLLNSFTVLTFVVDWKTAKKYPALAIFYINVCFFVSYSGWLVQFLGSETREDIVCRKDGTLRKSEPSASENLSCVVVFVMVYYFLIAGMVWFVIFTYAWHMSSLQALGKIQERIDKKRAYFHLIAWSLPLILTITTMALGEIDGDSVSGICFVGFVTPAARAGLLLAPLAAVIIVGGYIISRGLIILIRVKIESRDIISQHSSSKIRSNIVRMGVFALFLVVFSIISFLYHGYIFANSKQWEASLRSYILCRLTSLGTDASHCRHEARPSVAMLQLQLLAVFGAGIAVASWVWCEGTLHAWGRYFRRKFHCEVEEPMKIQKHQIIAQAFAKRKKFNDGGEISVDCQNHTDPIGLYFDINSAASNELSTTWAANLPRLVNRRGAVPNAANGSISSRQNSIDSEMSFSVRHVSIESRRNSGDSQVSVQFAELKTTRKVREGRSRSRRHRMEGKRRGAAGAAGYETRKRRSKIGSKRESSTSLDSHLQFLNVLAAGNPDIKTIVPNLGRRTANAGLDGQHINNLLNNGKLVIPFNMGAAPKGGGGNNSASEEENVSVTISESKINMVVSERCGYNVGAGCMLDLNDQQVITSLRQGLHIEEINTSDSDDKSYKKPERKSYSRSDRDSRQSRRSRRESHRRRHGGSDMDLGTKRNVISDLDGGANSSSECAELTNLAVQSSLNSGISVGTQHNCEKNRGSKQSKTSIDVGVQANAREIATQTLCAYEGEQNSVQNGSRDPSSSPTPLYKTKQAKTKENRKQKYNKYEEIEMKKSKSKYGSNKTDDESDDDEKTRLRKYCDLSDDDEDDMLIKKRNYNNVKIKKSKEIS